MMKPAASVSAMIREALAELPSLIPNRFRRLELVSCVRATRCRQACW